MCTLCALTHSAHGYLWPAPMFDPRYSLSDFHMNKPSDPNMKIGLNTDNLQVYMRAYL